MKIYVDELPIKVGQRVIYFDDEKLNCIELMFDSSVEPEEIVLISEHDKQVRKQVCDDIRKQIKPYYGEEISGFVAENILDQIDKGGGNAERKKSESNSR